MSIVESNSHEKVTIISGGAGEMGFAAAKLMGKDHHVVISDVNAQRLEAARVELKQLGIACTSVACNILDRTSVNAMFDQARTLGRLTSVIHTAGISPQMADPRTILEVNALGTINVSDAAYAVAQENFALVNVASMAAHLLPSLLIPQRAYSHALNNPDIFIKKALFLCRLMPKEIYRTGMAYSISKNFVVWYSKKLAYKFGQKGARILSVSPGSFDTEMGRLEEKSGSAEMLKKAALKRFGRPEEIAELLVFCASEKAGYLTGIDILCDGGVVASNVR